MWDNIKDKLEEIVSEWTMYHWIEMTLLLLILWNVW